MLQIQANETIRKCRKARGLTQVALSQMTQIPQSQISLYECGSRMPSLYSAWLLADALEVSLDELVGRGAEA
nr:helix-turn-helix transcriptional regulator [Maliibacterium massiliense]